MIDKLPSAQSDCADCIKSGGDWDCDHKHCHKGKSTQSEIIRCRDCKHWDKTWTNNWYPDYHYCPMIDEVRKGDFYCRYAERRTDE